MCMSYTCPASSVQLMQQILSTVAVSTCMRSIHVGFEQQLHRQHPRNVVRADICSRPNLAVRYSTSLGWMCVAISLSSLATSSVSAVMASCRRRFSSCIPCICVSSCWMSLAMNRGSEFISACTSIGLAAVLRVASLLTCRTSVAASATKQRMSCALRLT